ncbi:Las1-domain-containing protein [Meredithblackwellia eburnea MCA 4105]
MATQRRRTAWTSSVEFQAVFSSLFTSDGDVTAQRWAIQRIKVWLARGSNCPHSVESTATLLECILRDTQSEGTSVRPSQLELRLAYSMALIRFVNSLVDPLQTTYYARSMASLAVQLGLPLWFVELRHAATHENLPGLVVLRDASRQALDWLYNSYWLPAVSATNSNSETIALPSIEPLQALLSSYKTLTKEYIRDASKVSKTKSQLVKVYKGIESWVVEAEGMGRGRDRALDGLVDALLMVGGLVPTAKKKRPNQRSPALPTALQTLWTPLLSKLSDLYESFMDILLNHAVELLSEGQQEDPTVDTTIISWVIHFLQAADDPVATEGVIKSCLFAPTTSTLSLLDALIREDESLEESVRPLMNVIRNSTNTLETTIETNEAASKLEEMERRLLEFEQQLQAAPVLSVASSQTKTSGTSRWQVVDNWTPAPIGALPCGGFRTLDLASSVFHV